MQCKLPLIDHRHKERQNTNSENTAKSTSMRMGQSVSARSEDWRLRLRSARAANSGVVSPDACAHCRGEQDRSGEGGRQPSLQFQKAGIAHPAGVTGASLGVDELLIRLNV